MAIIYDYTEWRIRMIILNHGGSNQRAAAGLEKILRDYLDGYISVYWVNGKPVVEVVDESTE
jgi:hypothetical protein